MVDMIDSRGSDGFVAVATQGNGMYSTYYDHSLSVNEQLNDQSTSLKSYPNPFHNQLTIEYELTHDVDVSLSLTDMNGKLLKKLYSGQKQKGTYTIELNLDGLSQGIYLVKFEADNTNVFHKMIKN